MTKLYILSGFLGAGKTTALVKMIDRLSDQRIGIIQNEFGKLSIDGLILKSHPGIELVEINRGSVFCSCLEKTFEQALGEMADRDFDYLFVESSGWGDPSNCQQILDAVEAESGKNFDFRGVLCFVDALNFPGQIRTEETAFRQLKHCHLTILTKTDLVSEEQASSVREAVRQINPVCGIIESVMGEMDLSFLREDLLANQWAEAEETTNSAETKPKSISLTFEGSVERESMDSYLRAVASDAYRIKGFGLIGQKWYQVDVVGAQIDYKEAGEQEKSQLVFISKIGPQIIRRISDEWKSRVGTPMTMKN